MDTPHHTQTFWKGQEKYNLSEANMEFIHGWYLGLYGVCNGEKRRILLPWEIAYGSRRDNPKPHPTSLKEDVKEHEVEFELQVTRHGNMRRVTKNYNEHPSDGRLMYELNQNAAPKRDQETSIGETVGELIPLPDHDDVPHQEGLSFGNDQPLGPLTDDELMNIMKEQRRFMLE